jgi:RimJ/RimL family protein N-acetyltransferase
MTTDGTAINFSAHIRLRGLGLVLREWSDQDLPVMVELFDDPHVDRWTPLRSPFDLTAARTYLDRARDQRAAGRRLQLAVTTDGQDAKGEILLTRIGTNDRDAELAYAIGPKHRRQRLAARAVELITTYAHAELAINQVLLRIPEHNHASAAVARTAGFELTDAPPITREGVRYSLLTWRHHREH